MTDEEAADFFENSDPSDRAVWGEPIPGPAAFRGRPSLSAGGGVTPRRGIRLPAPLDDRYRRRAAATGVSVSELMREVLTRHAPRG